MPLPYYNGYYNIFLILFHHNESV